MSRLLPLTVTLAALALSASAAGAASDFGGHTRKSVRFLALGDSYTIGEGVAEHERWPEQLAATLADNGYAVGVKVVARTGWTTDELWDALQDSRL